MKAIKNALGGTLNDAVLAAVASRPAAGCARRGTTTEDLVLRAMVPVSVRADVERGALGNRVAAIYAPLPVDLDDPAETFAYVHEAMGDLKGSGQAVGAQRADRARRLRAHDDPEPGRAAADAPAALQPRRDQRARARSSPLYLLGRRLRRPLPGRAAGARQALGIAIMSYDGRLGFGLLGDYDAMPELDALGRRARRRGRRPGARGRAGPAARRARRTGPRVRPRDPAST